MGDANAYRELQKFGVKEFKYRQNQHTSAVRKSGVLLAEDARYIKGGACAALVSVWIHDKLSSRNSFVSRDRTKEGISLEEKQQINSHNDRLMTKVAPYQKEYILNNKEFGNDQARKMMFRKLHFEANTDLNEIASPGFRRQKAEDHLAQVWPRIKDGQAAYIVITYRDEAMNAKVSKGTSSNAPPAEPEETDGNHAVAIFRSGQMLHFFDPNIGAYQINSDRIPKFFKCWQKVHDASYETQLGKIDRFYTKIVNVLG